jgi:integrase
MARKEGSVTVSAMIGGVRRYFTADTHDEAVEKRAIAKKAYEEGRIIYDKNTLVKDWIDKWLVTYKEPNVNPDWYKRLKGICKNYIIPKIGLYKVTEVKPIQLTEIINSNMKSKSFNDKLYDTLCQIFQEAYKNSMILSDITKSVQRSNAKYKHRRSITDTERKYLLQVIEKHPGKNFVLLMLYAGLRPGEVCALQWKDIDFKNKTITINKALKSDGVIRPEPKSDAGNRVIPLPDKLIEGIDASLKSPFEPVCVTAAGTRYNKQSFKRMWNGIRYNMNIAMGCKTYRNHLLDPKPLSDDFYLYCLRHTYCTDLQSAGVPINVARELMGHNSIEMTSKIYTHHSDDSIADALEKINNYSVVPCVVPKSENE